MDACLPSQCMKFDLYAKFAIHYIVTWDKSHNNKT